MKYALKPIPGTERWVIQNTETGEFVRGRDPKGNDTGVTKSWFKKHVAESVLDGLNKGDVPKSVLAV